MGRGPRALIASDRRLLQGFKGRQYATPHGAWDLSILPIVATIAIVEIARNRSTERYSRNSREVERTRCSNICDGEIQSLSALTKI